MCTQHERRCCQRVCQPWGYEARILAPGLTRFPLSTLRNARALRPHRDAMTQVGQHIGSPPWLARLNALGVEWPRRLSRWQRGLPIQSKLAERYMDTPPAPQGISCESFAAPTVVTGLPMSSDAGGDHAAPISKALLGCDRRLCRCDRRLC